MLRALVGGGAGAAGDGAAINWSWVQQPEEGGGGQVGEEGARACVIEIIVTAIIYLCRPPPDAIGGRAELTRRAATRPKRRALCSLSAHRLCLTSPLSFIYAAAGTPHISRV